MPVSILFICRGFQLAAAAVTWVPDLCAGFVTCCGLNGINGKTLQQSPAHALQQRFFALIEAGSAPFPVGIGPGNFGASFKAASELLVKNGALGLSSHHGIHGNTDERGINGVVERCHKIALYDVTASNFEVAVLDDGSAEDA